MNAHGLQVELYRGLATLAVLAAAASGDAHDFWIEPATFRPVVDSPVRITLRVGDEFPGESVARNPENIAEFFVQGPDAKKAPVAALPQAEPAGVTRIAQPGVHLLAYTSKGSRSELAAEKFERYLHEEGLEAVSRERAKAGESGKGGTETYYRSVKSLVVAGDPTAAGYDKALGLPLELIPEHNPSTLASTRKVTFRLLYQGKAVEGVLVRARRRGADDKVLENATARSNDDGRVELELTGNGFWLVTAVHMTRAADPTKGDWESYWASLTFEAGSGAGETQPAPRPDSETEQKSRSQTVSGAG